MPTLFEPTLDATQNLPENPLLALKAVHQSAPDTMYLWQAMKQPDWAQFKHAMQEEVNAHTVNGHWKLIKRSALPKGATVLPAVWSMKRKRRISTREVYKWKARLTVDGSKQKYGVHYDKTYSPVVMWATTRFFLIQSILLGWHSRQVDFTLAYPQVDVERPLYMEVPKGVQVEVGGTTAHAKEYVLQLIKNLYGQKQAGCIWYLWLTDRLKKAGSQQSKIDPCVFYYQGNVLLIYVDDTIILGPTTQGIENILAKLRSQFNVNDGGDMSDYLGVKETREKNGTIHLTQPHLIKSILRDLHLIDNKQATTRTLPALTTKILHPNATGTSFNNRTFHYRSIIGKRNFLEKSTRPDLAYATHQCAHFVENPTELHAEAVKCIGRYLLGTCRSRTHSLPFQGQHII
jgi:hypothetical protein